MSKLSATGKAVEGLRASAMKSLKGFKGGKIPRIAWTKGSKG